MVSRGGLNHPAKPLGECEECCVCAYKDLNFRQVRWLQSVHIVVKQSAASGHENKVSEPKPGCASSADGYMTKPPAIQSMTSLPGLRGKAIPMNWTCPECGARKEDFEMVQI